MWQVASLLAYCVRRGLCEGVWDWPLDVVVVSVVYLLYHLGLYEDVWILLECGVSALECDMGSGAVYRDGSCHVCT